MGYTKTIKKETPQRQDIIHTRKKKSLRAMRLKFSRPFDRDEIPGLTRAKEKKKVHKMASVIKLKTRKLQRRMTFSGTNTPLLPLLVLTKEHVISFALQRTKKTHTNQTHTSP